MYLKRPQLKLPQSNYLLFICWMFPFIKRLIISPVVDLLRFKSNINNGADTDNCWITAVNNSWLQVSCEGWCWHRENRMSNMFLAAAAAACGSGSDPFGNLPLKLQAAQRYYIIQSWSRKVSFWCFLRSSCSVAALYAITSSSLKPKALVLVHHASQSNSHPPSTWPIRMKNQPLKESISIHQ